MADGLFLPEFLPEYMLSINRIAKMSQTNID